MGIADHDGSPAQRSEHARTTVLVVEDEPELRETLAELLASEGFLVRTAPNGREALDEMQREAPHLILLDLAMPVMSGWEVLKVREKDERLRQIPLIVLTAAVDRPEGVPVIEKPLLLVDLVKTIRQAARSVEARERGPRGGGASA